MKFTVFILAFLLLYVGAMAYLYFTQDAQIFNKDLIEKTPATKLYQKHKTSLKVEEDVVLDGIHIHNQMSDVLFIYFGGNADDATRIAEHLPNLKDNLIAFNYRGYANSTGAPSQEAIFKDALRIYDSFAKEYKVIVMGRSLGTGVASYIASQREPLGIILITPYDSIASMAKKRYPYFPIEWLLRHKFESTKYLQDLPLPVGLIEVVGDKVVTQYHFEKLKKSVKNLALHVSIQESSHAQVLAHEDFETTVYKMSKAFLRSENVK